MVMAKFKITITKTQTQDVIVSAPDKLTACAIAKKQAKEMKWDSIINYDITNLESGI